MQINKTGIDIPSVDFDNKVKTDKSAADFQTMLEKAANSKEDKPLRDAANQFEAMFMYQMFQQMKSTVEKGGLTEQGMGEKIFQDMLDFEVTNRAVSGKSIGLADIIYKQMKSNAEQVNKGK